MKRPRRLKPDTALTPAITLSQALNDPELFGETFAALSFWTWKVVAKLIDGIALTEKREIALFEQATGRKYNRHARRAVRRLILLVGRRGGKDRFWSAVAVWRAALCTNWREHVSAGEGAVVLLLGADKKQAAILRRYCWGLLEVDRLKREVVRQTSELIEFRNGASLEIATNDVSLIRGRSAIAVIGSEAAHWKTDEASASSDEEVVGAAEPSMSMCPDGGLLLLGSSVHRRVGYMYRQYRELYGDADADDLCWFAPSLVMNPKLPASVIAKAVAKDPAKGGAEYLNEWRIDEAAFVSRELIQGVVDRGVRVRPFNARFQYLAYLDASSGVHDSFGLSISHRAGDIALQDCLTEVRAPFNTAQATAQIAATLKSYGVRTVMGDDHARSWLKHELALHGITLLPRPTAMSGSDFHLETLALFTSGRARLLDQPRLVDQYCALERRLRGDREIISHPIHGHDDLCVATSGSLFLASRSAGSLWRADHFLVDGRAAEVPRNVLGLYVVLIGSDTGELAAAYFKAARIGPARQQLYLVDVELTRVSPQSLLAVHTRLNALFNETPSLQEIVEMCWIRQMPIPVGLCEVYCPSVIGQQLDDVLGRSTNTRPIDYLLASGDLALAASVHINSDEVKLTGTVRSKPFGLGFLDGLGRTDDCLETAVLGGAVIGFHSDRLIRPRAA